MTPPWSKMSGDLDQNPKIREAGRNGREVYLFLLRRNCTLDASGTIPASNARVRYLADQLMCSEADAQDGIDRAVAADLIWFNDGSVVIDGWDDEWGRRPLTEAERKRKQRSKDVRTDADVSGQAKPCPDSVPAERDSPECHTGERRERGEETSGLPDALVLVSIEPEQPAAWLLLAEACCSELNAAMGTKYKPDTKDTARCARGRAKDRRTPEQVRAVTLDRIAAWRADAKMAEFLRPATLLSSNFDKYLDDLESRPGSRRTGTAHGGAGPPAPMALNFMGGLEPLHPNGSDGDTA